ELPPSPSLVVIKVSPLIHRVAQMKEATPTIPAIRILYIAEIEPEPAVSGLICTQPRSMTIIEAIEHFQRGQREHEKQIGRHAASCAKKRARSDSERTVEG